MSKIHFGILGCGNIAKRFAKALAKSEKAELCGCAAREFERAEKFASEYGGKAYESYAALLSDPSIEAVYIATVHNTHAEIARMAILSGKAVLCEKPFFVHAKEAREIMALAKEKNVLIMEGFWTRTQPAYQKAVSWLKEGKIGKLRMIRTSFCFAMPEWLKDSRIWKKETAGGAFLDAGVYPYEFVTGLMGGAPQELQYMVELAPTGVDMTVAFNMRYPDGVIANCMTSVGGQMDSTGILSGSEGYIEMDYFLGCRKARLYQGRQGLVETFEDPEEEGFVHEIGHFCDLIHEGKIESDINTWALTLDFAEKADEILGEKKPKAPTKFSLEDLIRQEETYRFETFQAQEAEELGELLRRMSKEDGKAAAIQIELGDMEVYRWMPQGTNAFNDYWMQKKKSTVRMMGKSTLRLWTEMAMRGVPRKMEMLPQSDIVFCGGGFPILLKDGTRVGVITVSGPGDEYEHDLIVRALEKMLG